MKIARKQILKFIRIKKKDSSGKEKKRYKKLYNGAINQLMLSKRGETSEIVKKVAPVTSSCPLFVDDILNHFNEYRQALGCTH